MKKELALGRMAKAQKHPTFMNVDVINALQEAARLLEETNPRASALYKQMAQNALGQSGQEQPPPSSNGTGLAPNVLPASIQKETGGTAR